MQFDNVEALQETVNQALQTAYNLKFPVHEIEQRRARRQQPQVPPQALASYDEAVPDFFHRNPDDYWEKIEEFKQSYTELEVPKIAEMDNNNNNAGRKRSQADVERAEAAERKKAEKQRRKERKAREEAERARAIGRLRDDYRNSCNAVRSGQYRMTWTPTSTHMRIARMGQPGELAPLPFYSALIYESTAPRVVPPPTDPRLQRQLQPTPTPVRPPATRAIPPLRPPTPARASAVRPPSLFSGGFLPLPPPPLPPTICRQPPPVPPTICRQLPPTATKTAVPPTICRHLPPTATTTTTAPAAVERRKQLGQRKQQQRQPPAKKRRQASSDETWSEDDVKAVPLIAAPRRRLVIESDDEDDQAMEH
ncbi:hypothetical protein GPALN_004444 [Globodera pallida]|nr:hypothetical protein GPALN_004444 [Globodera pallida]